MELAIDENCKPFGNAREYLSAKKTFKFELLGL